MCGIAGILRDDIDLRNEKTLLTKMSESLKDRGPDGEGRYVEQSAAIIHRRLAIIDPKGGAQPMRFGNYIIAYNGEIYNTEEVRNELKSFGYTFDTTCDTEVVLKAYHKWKEESVKKLNGIFAYAIFDVKTKKLFGARDRIGVKPFFYSKKGALFAFASKIETLLFIDDIKRVVDEEGLSEIFMLGPARTIGKAVFKDISELPPASYLEYEKGKLKISSYWRLEAREHKDSFEETIDHTRYLVRDAIERQLVSDVPVCTFLSGGLDSSIISEIAADCFRRKGEVLTTYSVDYTDNDKFFKKSLFQPNKDSDYIGMISEYIGSDHRNVVLDNVQLADALFDAVYARGVPGFTDVDSSLLLFCREVKKDFKVCLSGECADEIFGGYPWYHRKEILFEETFPWSRSVDVRKSLLKDGLLKNGAEYVHSAYQKTVDDTSFLDSDSKLEKRMRQMFRLNMDWFMQTLLMRKDAMSMASSLEVRVPFCDWRIVEYAYNMPWAFKSPEDREKGILRMAFENELPYEIAWRKKSPYPKTFNPDYFKRVKEMVSVVLTDTACPLYEMLNKDTVYKLCYDPDLLPEPWYGQLMRGVQVLAYIVQIYYWIKKYNVTFDI